MSALPVADILAHAAADGDYNLALHRFLLLPHDVQLDTLNAVPDGWQSSEETFSVRYRRKRLHGQSGRVSLIMERQLRPNLDRRQG